jgi:hypothetical protein
MGLIALGLLAAPAAAGPDGYEQKQGKAALHLSGGKLENDVPVVALSDHLRLTLSVEGGPNLEVEKLSAVTASKFWEVRRSEEPQTTPLPGGGRRWEQAFILEPMKNGELVLQVAPLRYREEQGEEAWKTVTWKPVTVRVTTEVASADLKEIRDITGPEPVPPPPSLFGVLRWVGLGIIGVALLLGGWELRRRFVAPRPEQAPHEWASRELDRIEAMALPQAGHAERFHTLVSDTIRRYIELRFDLHAPRQTTAEFLEATKQSPQLTSAQQGLLRDFLERCDLAKFARAEYSVPECQAALGMARTFVDQTAPAKASPEPVARLAQSR